MISKKNLLYKLPFFLNAVIFLGAFSYGVGADTLQSKVGFSLRPNSIESGVVPPEIPQNGQVIHYSALPKTAVKENEAFIILGTGLLIVVLILFLLNIKKHKNGEEI